MKKYTKEEINNIADELYDFASVVDTEHDTKEYMGSCVTPEFCKALFDAYDILSNLKEDD